MKTPHGRRYLRRCFRSQAAVTAEVRATLYAGVMLGAYGDMSRAERRVERGGGRQGREYRSVPFSSCAQCYLLPPMPLRERRWCSFRLFAASFPEHERRGRRETCAGTSLVALPHEEPGGHGFARAYAFLCACVWPSLLVAVSVVRCRLFVDA